MRSALSLTGSDVAGAANDGPIATRATKQTERMKRIGQGLSMKLFVGRVFTVRRSGGKWHASPSPSTQDQKTMSAANRGQFVWHELITTDTTGASDFYPRIAGWKTQPWEVDNNYTLLVGEGGPL